MTSIPPPSSSSSSTPHPPLLPPPMPLLSITSPATIDKCKSFRLRPSDIFICSYPKSGTTWTQYIVVSLIVADQRQQQQQQQQQQAEEDNNNVLSYNHISDFAPFFEIDAHWEPHGSNALLAEGIRNNHDRLHRRIFNTHLRWDMLPKESERHATTSSFSSSETETTRVENNNNYNNIHTKQRLLRPACGKFIYVTRNLPDVCASFYHHLSNQKEGRYIGDFTSFFHDWMSGTTIPFGSPLHHLISFAEGFGCNEYSSTPEDDENAPTTTTATTTTIDQKCTNSNINQCQNLRHHHHQQKQHSPLLLLSYEKMKTNLRQEVLKIIDFLQLDNISMKVLDTELLPTFCFQFMKENSHMFQPKSVTWLNGYQFLRKGEIGDGTKMLLMETTMTTATKASLGTSARTGSSSDEEANVTVLPLMDIFREWVREEEYCQKINELESRGLTREASEQFRAVVHGVCG